MAGHQTGTEHSLSVWRQGSAALLGSTVGGAQNCRYCLWHPPVMIPRAPAEVGLLAVIYNSLLWKVPVFQLETCCTLSKIKSQKKKKRKKKWSQGQLLLDTVDTWVLCGGCITELLIINKYDDVISLYSDDRATRRTRGSEGEKVKVLICELRIGLDQTRDDCERTNKELTRWYISYEKW